MFQFFLKSINNHSAAVAYGFLSILKFIGFHEISVGDNLQLFFFVAFFFFDTDLHFRNRHLHKYIKNIYTSI